MNKDAKDIIIVSAVTFIIILSAVGALFLYSGMSYPLTIVESGSMEHSERSQIGVIDTGDMVVMRNPDMTTIETFVEGRVSGHQTFGSYGDVIIYRRTADNPVIHRALLYLDYNNDGTWTAKALENYPANLWSNGDNTDWKKLSGNLTLYDVDYNGNEATVNLDSPNLLTGGSGYWTKGDHNKYSDQTAGIINTFVGKNLIKAVAGFEVPWFGCIKLYYTNTNIDQIQYNSMPCLGIVLLDIVMFFLVLGVIFECLFSVLEKRKQQRAEDDEERK